LKKEIDSDSKAKKGNTPKDKEPRRGTREFSNDPANVETKAGRVAIEAGQVKLAPCDGWNGLVFHGF
tara:strand:- start:783 stop:983 length:201 start_codon:yes stop_codon:yes gene_type:complete